MKTTSFQTSNNLTGLRSITFQPAEQGNMLSRLERLRQLAVDSLKERTLSGCVPPTKQPITLPNF